MLNTIIDIVRECGEILLNAEGIDNSVTAKEGRANYVTAYDKRVQEILFERLGKAFPEAVFVGEEEDVHPDISSGMAFIIDPIDGTTNFMKGYDMSAISVGVIMDGKRHAGVIYNPYKNECFSAIKGQGAYLNGNPIRVSNNKLADSLVLFGTSPYYEELSRRSFEMAHEYCLRSIDVRRSGAAAIDLCDIACGRCGFFFELKLQPWDFAAGITIVEEAGGIVVSENNELIPVMEASSIFAMNPVIYKEIF